MPRQKVVIQVDGKAYYAKYLGRGKFSRVYQVGNRAIYYTLDDCTKEVLALYYHGGTPHLPEIIRHDNITIGRFDYQVYSSPVYRDLRRTDTSAYRIMKEILEWNRSFYQMCSINGIRYKLNYDTMIKFVEYCRTETDLPRSIVKALQEITELSSNCGYDIMFDFHKKNFGVNAYGTLIFRDVVALSDRVR